MADEDPIVLKNFPPMFNGTSVPFFPVIDNNPEDTQKVHKSEGGRRIVQTIRMDRLSASVKLKVADDAWVRFFMDLWKNYDSFEFKQYSPLLQGYDTRTVCIENFKWKQVKDSEDLGGVIGVWEMSFDIEEF